MPTKIKPDASSPGSGPIKRRTFLGLGLSGFASLSLPGLVRRLASTATGFLRGATLYLALAITFMPCLPVSAEKPPEGYLMKNGRAIFPIGSYELPKADAELRAMAEAGFNLVHCGNVADFDRAQAAGMFGWISVPLQLGADNDALRKTVEAVKDHPALAVWEGPDEVVWNFTAYSGLHRTGVYKKPDEWWQQTPFAIEHSEAEARKILPQLRAGCRFVRRLDRSRHPIWSQRPPAKPEA